MLSKCDEDKAHFPPTALYVEDSTVSNGDGNGIDSEEPSSIGDFDQQCAVNENNANSQQTNAQSVVKSSWHDVDVIMYNRKLLAAFITDSVCLGGKDDLKPASTMPSVLPPDMQTRVVAAAYQSCTEIGKFSPLTNCENVFWSEYFRIG